MLLKLHLKNQEMDLQEVWKNRLVKEVDGWIHDSNSVQTPTTPTQWNVS